MISLNAIVSRIESFAANHYFIKTFSFGKSADSLDIEKLGTYPALYLVYNGADYGEGTKTYNFELYLIDLPGREEEIEEQRKEAVSDSEQCLEDILADIESGGNIFLFDEDYNVENGSVLPVYATHSNVLAGALLDISISVPYDRSACNLPLDGVEPEGGEFTYARRGLLRMLTLDGETDVLSVNTIRVTNGTLTDNGNGDVTLDTGGGGAMTLVELEDTLIEDELDTQALVYDEATQAWINARPDRIPVRNASPSQTLFKGSIVQYAGTQGDRILVELWDNASPSAYIVGILDANLSGGADGHVQTYGELRKIDTSDYQLNDILYAAAGGTFTTTENSLPVASVTRVHANTGRIFIRLYVPGDHYRDRFRAEAYSAATATSIAPAAVECYYTAQANGDGFYQNPGSDTPRTEGDIVRRTLYWKSGAFEAINASGYTEIVLADDATYAELLAALDDILNANGSPVTIWTKREEVTPSAAILDGYTADLVGAFAPALLVPGYSGACIRIRRSGDNAETDIGFDGTDLDRAAIAAFCSPGDGFVKTWYNQDGSGNHATQTSNAQQPKIYDASTGVELDNLLPAVTYDTSLKTLEAPLAIAHVPLSVFIVQSGPSTQADIPFDLGNTASAIEYTRLQSNAGAPKVQQLLARSVADGLAAANISDNFDQGLITIISKATNDRNIGVNGGTFVNLSTNVTTIDSNFLRIGNQPTEVVKQQAVIIYNADKSADRAGIEAAINGYFNIYP